MDFDWLEVVSLVASFIAAVLAYSSKRKLKVFESEQEKNFAVFNILLKKEFDYYEKVDPLYAKVIITIHDIIDNLKGVYPNGKQILLKNRKEKAKENNLCFLDVHMKLKNELLQNDIYLTDNIMISHNNVIDIMLEVIPLIDLELRKLFNERNAHIDVACCDSIKNKVLNACATARGDIIIRLRSFVKK